MTRRRVGTHLLGIVALLFAACAAITLLERPRAAPAATPPRIMPLGDSITLGSGDGNPSGSSGGYRTFLEDQLVDGGASFSFVGSLAEGPESLSDKDHEGHGGYRIDQISAEINGWLSAHQPDVVLIMLGTNDVGQNHDLANAPARLGALLDQIFAARPGAHLVVASIPPRANATLETRTRNYNAAIPGLVNTRAASGKPVSYVEVHNALTLADLDDGAHPNASGYSKIATVFSGALQQLFNPPASMYLSDRAPVSATNGHGPVERDMSNGGAAAGDGGPIRLDGVTFAKGLGVHASSTVVYALGGASSVLADVGVDDECGGSAGSVVFQVFVDGVKRFDSGKMTGATATKSVVVDTTGKNQLKLVVTNASDGNACDHADWAGARLSGASPTSTTVPTSTSSTTTSTTTTTTTAPPGGSVYLSDRAPVSATNGHGPVERDMSNGGAAAGDGGPIRLDGVTFAKGLGVHASSTVVYALGGASSVLADVGVDDECGGSAGSVVFQVFVDGVKRFDSGKMTGATATKSVVVDTTGKNQLKLVVTNASDGNACDHADWAGARLTT